MSELSVGQVWRNNQSGKAWTIRRIATPPRREWPLIGSRVPVLGADNTSYEHGERIPWLLARYSFVAAGSSAVGAK